MVYPKGQQNRQRDDRINARIDARCTEFPAFTNSDLRQLQQVTQIPLRTSICESDSSSSTALVASCLW